MTQFCGKVQKPYFWAILGLFGPFLPIFEKMRIFPKNPALSLFYIYGPLTSLKISEKSNEPILRTFHHGQTSDGGDVLTECTRNENVDMND